jgi:hypothetical protein
MGLQMSVARDDGICKNELTDGFMQPLLNASIARDDSATGNHDALAELWTWIDREYILDLPRRS